MKNLLYYKRPGASLLKTRNAMHFKNYDNLLRTFHWKEYLKGKAWFS